MAATNGIFVNGVFYDWSSVEIRLDGVEFFGIKSIDYKDNLTPGEVYGAGSQKRGSTRGTYKAEGSIELYKADGDVFEQQLADKSPDVGLYEIFFNIDLIFAPDNNSSETTVKMVGCKITDRERSHASGGSDPLTKKYTLFVTYILENGIAPISNMNF